MLKKETKKKEGHYEENAWSPEQRWQDYLDEEARKKETEEKQKENSMFKEYNELKDTMKVGCNRLSQFCRGKIQRCTTKKGACISAIKEATTLFLRIATIVPRLSSGLECRNSWKRIHLM